MYVNDMPRVATQLPEVECVTFSKCRKSDAKPLHHNSTNQC